MTTTTSLPSSVLAQRAAQICLEHKANDVVILDLRGVSDMTDFFVIASGTSDTHVRALGEHVLEELKRDGGGAVAHHVEGLTQGRWVLLDYVDFVVHLFHPEVIVLGGGLSLVGEPLRATLAETLPRFIMEVFRPGPQIRLAALGEDAVPVGALLVAAGADATIPTRSFV